MPRRKKSSFNGNGEERAVESPAAAAGQGERQSIYFPKDMADEIKAEALRQDRSISWIMQKAWRIARPKMRQLPGANELEADISPPKAAAKVRKIRS